MPSFAADSIDTSTHAQSPLSFSLATRNSAGKPPLGREHAEKQPNGITPTPTMNGINSTNGNTPNGKPVMQPVPNGRSAAPAQSDKGTRQNESARRGWSMDSEAPSKRSDSRGNSQEMPSGRDDGYFASVYSGEVHEGHGTMKVKLDTSSFNDGARSNPNTPGRHDSDSRHSQPLPSHTEDPNSTNRVSSPPAFNHITPAQSSQSSHPYRLQHRHTLEVPGHKTSGTRARDFQTQSTDDVGFTSGRFSPSANTPTRRRGSLSLARRTTRSIHSDMHLEEVPQDEEAARWAEHIRQKRASKRKREDKEDDDRVVVGTKVDQNHVNWVTAYNMLTGIRFTVSRTNAKMDRDLTDADFGAKHKFSFDMYVSSSTFFEINAYNLAEQGTNLHHLRNTTSNSRTTRLGYSAIFVPPSS
jgi:1-phosphatidylinositol-4-phosphate 5-kinase